MELVRDVPVRKSKITVGFKGLANSTDQSLADMTYAKTVHNFAFEKGVLTGGIGIDSAEGYYPDPYIERHAYPPLPEGRTFRNVFLYRRKAENSAYGDRLVAHMDNYRFMYTSVFAPDEWHEIPDLMINDDVTAVNYNYNGHDVLLLSAKDNDLFMIQEGTAFVCGNAPMFTSIEVHGERVFGSINGAQNQVWFSDDFNPINWSVSATEAGFINFADECGDILKLVSFLGYLYIFREGGIFRLTAIGDQSEFMLKKMFTDTGRIVKDSIELCGDKIIFYSDTGLFAFDGYEVTRIGSELPDIFRTRIMDCAYLDDCYYMACRTESDGDENNTVIRYGLKDKTLSVLFGYSVKKLRTVKTHNAAQVLCITGGDTLGAMSESGKVMGATTDKSYLSPENALGSPYVKTVRSATFQSDKDITLSVILDGKSYDYPVKGSPHLRTVPIERSGRKIGFKISCNSAEAHVTPLIVAVDALRI